MPDSHTATSPRLVLDWLRDADTGGVHRVSRGDRDFVAWSEVYRDVSAVATHLIESGISEGDRVGIRGDNSYQWLVLDLALLQIGAVPVAVPISEFVDRSHEDLAQQYGLVAMFADKAGRRAGGAAAVALESLLDLPLVTPQLAPTPQGQQLPATDQPHFTLAFSSGTAGRVKCLLMVWRGVQRLIEVTAATYSLGRSDRIMIALPLSTFQQRFLCYLAIRSRCDVVLTTTARYLPALREGTPTIVLGPPNFYEFAASRFANEGRFLRAARLLLSGAAVGLPGRRARQRWRRLIFRSYHEMFGGQMRLMLVGSAPVRREMLDFFHRAGFELHQIYGMTEIGYISWNRPGASRIGSVGTETYPGTVSLAADGEVTVTHPWHICCGYEGEPAESVAAVFRDEQTIATGDLGYFDGEYLFLKGRKKNVIVTPGGVKVSLEELESELAGAVGVNRAALIQVSDEPELAVVAWYRGDQTIVRDEIRLRVDRLSKRLGVGSQVRRIALIEGELGHDSPLLNRNLKVDREAVRAAVADRWEAID